VEGKASRITWRFVAFIWMVVEIGQFVAIHLRLGQNSLFWPFWICFAMVVFLVTYTFDLRNMQQRKWQDGIHQPNSPEDKTGDELRNQKD